MGSIYTARAIEDCLRYGKAILKFISANDLNLTGGHQAGFYLPKQVWELFSSFPPTKDQNYKHSVQVLWPDGQTTDSMLSWYGVSSRSEYRLTKFGRDFPWRTPEQLGSLLVVIPVDFDSFIAYIFDEDADVEELQAALGVEIISTWTYYKKGEILEETEDECLDRNFREYVSLMEELPSGLQLSERTRMAMTACIDRFIDFPADDRLIGLMREEYKLYKLAERKVYEPDVQRLFGSIDDFLGTANRILNGRKSRAGRSLENHVEFLLKEEGIPFASRPHVDKTRPDILIPGEAEYNDKGYPAEKLIMLGVKRTCKDRWRQVVSEAPRVKHKHLLTMQEGISKNQISEMKEARITLVVPKSLHKAYPSETRKQLLTVEQFIDYAGKGL
jgi:hypothetical protein